MRFQGTFHVSVADVADTYHPAGSWRVGPSDIHDYEEPGTCSRFLPEDGEPSFPSAADRVRAVFILSETSPVILDAASHTGGTGVRGVVTACSPCGTLTVEGEAWFASGACYMHHGTGLVRTHAFDIVLRDGECHYAGSLEGIRGMGVTNTFARLDRAMADANARPARVDRNEDAPSAEPIRRHARRHA